MNVPLLDRSKLYAALGTIGERHGLRVLDLLPKDSVGHPSDPLPVVFLAEKSREDLSVLDVCVAEVDLHESLGFATRILLRDELAGSPAGRKLLGEICGL